MEELNKFMAKEINDLFISKVKLCNFRLLSKALEKNPI